MEITFNYSVLVLKKSTPIHIAPGSTTLFSMTENYNTTNAHASE